MENFKTLLEQDNIIEIENFMKNSKIDLLKSIAKRFKVSTTGKKKTELITEIKLCVSSKKPFGNEPNIAMMSVAQLKNKAIELNIDVSSLKMKQALKMAILDKIKTSKESSSPATIASTMDNYGMLNSKSVPYLKALAKQLKIKISKLSKEQLITSILEKTSSQGILPVLQQGDLNDINIKTLSKLTKNELLLKANELGFVGTKTTKDELIKYIIKTDKPTTETSTSPKTDKPTAPKIKMNLTFPIKSSDLDNIKKNFTIVKIKQILSENKIKIPTGSKKEELLKLLLLIKPNNDESISPSTPTFIPEDIDIVPLEDIHSPFTPANINDLTEEPTDKDLSEDVLRCLKFYEYPQ